MNWLNPLRRKPEPELPAARAVPPLPSPAEIDRRRSALSAAAGEPARVQAQQALGEVCAALGIAPQEGDDAAVWCAAVRHCGEKGLALDWLARLQDETHFEELARHARFTEVRLAAAQRIADPARLESLARDAKARDKNVYRHCSELLRGRRQAQQRAVLAAALEQSLRIFLGGAPLSVTRLLELEKELRALAVPGGEAGQEAEAALQACEALCSEANARLRREGERLRRLQLAQQELTALAEVALAAGPDAPAIDQWRARLATLRAPRDELPDWPSALAAVEAFERGASELDVRFAALVEDARRTLSCEAFLDGLADPLPEDASQAWDALELPLHAPTRTALEARWSGRRAAAIHSVAPAKATRASTAEAGAAGGAVVAGLAGEGTAGHAADTEASAASQLAAGTAKTRGGARARRADPEALRGALHELEHALDEGHLAQADIAERRLKQVLEGGTPPGRLEGSLLRAQSRLAELHNWAEWGARQQRDQLIVAAQELLTGGHGVDHVAAAVPAMRDAWKRLNTQGAATREQWLAFDSALEKAYAPVAVQRAQEAARREQARAFKAALLDEWEKWYAAIDRARPDAASIKRKQPDATAIDGERPDAAAIDLERPDAAAIEPEPPAALAIDHEPFDAAAIERQAERLFARWREAPHAGFRDERQLRKRVDRLRAGVGQFLAAVRSSEAQRREQLVVQAQTLLQESDVQRAISVIKNLQERWRAPPGAPRLARGEEQRLWRRFRAACDAVFARRDAQRNEESERRAQQAQVREEILQRFTAAIDGGDAGAIRRAQAQFQTEWRAAAPPEPDERQRGRGSPEHTGPQRGNSSSERAGPHRGKPSTDRAGPRRGTATTEHIGAQGGRSSPGRATPPQRKAPLDPHAQQAQALLQRARQAIEEGQRASHRARLDKLRGEPAGVEGLDADALARGRTEREDVLLDLELALDLASPPSTEAARRRRQLERLQDRFRGTVREKVDAEVLLARWHAIAAAADDEQERRLTAIVDRLVAQGARSA